jgi:membrane protein DedA with SNARE-associated domain
VSESTGIYAYFVIFGALVAAAFGFPIPEEIPIVTAGGLCAHAANVDPPVPHDWSVEMFGRMEPEAVAIAGALVAADYAIEDSKPMPRRHPVWWIMLPVCIAGVVICDALLYGVGRWGGPHLLDIGWVQRYVVNPNKRAKIEENFHRYGVRILLGARLLPGVRAPIFVMAGVMRLPVHRFLLADGVYALPGVTLFFVLAFWFTDQFITLVHRFEAGIGTLKPYLIIGGIAALGCFLLYEFLKRRVVTGDPKEIPLIGEKVIHAPAGGGDQAPQAPPDAGGPASVHIHVDGKVVSPRSEQSEASASKSSRRGVVVLALLAVLAAVAVVAWQFLPRGKSQ